jgi:hypothetical protein
VFAFSQAVIYAMYAGAFYFGAYLIEIGDMEAADVYRQVNLDVKVNPLKHRSTKNRPLNRAWLLHKNKKNEPLK